MIRGVVASALVLAVQLSACVGGPVANRPEQFLSERNLDGQPTPDAFDYCWDHSCNRVIRLGLTKEQWSEAVEPLRAATSSAEEERERLRAVVATFESIAGELAGTTSDRGGTMTAYGAGGQLDCVDETTNTTVLLMMLHEEQLLRWHRPSRPAGRGNLVDGLMPHRTAAISEIATGTEFAVDSWFHDNGAEPEVVAMALWLSGWTPEDGLPPAGATPLSRAASAEEAPAPPALQVSRTGRRDVPDCCAQAVDSGRRQREGSSDQAPQT